MTTPQRIEQVKIPECDSYVTRGYIFSESELNALLLQIQDEQKEICAEEAYIEYDFRGNEDVNREAIREAPYAYNPKEKV